MGLQSPRRHFAQSIEKPSNYHVRVSLSHSVRHGNPLTLSICHSFIPTYPLTRVQIVLTLHLNPMPTLIHFDLDQCAMAYDGSTVLFLPRAIRALESKDLARSDNILNSPLRRF